jgi:hypothetical protein
MNRKNRTYKSNPVFSIIPYFRKHNTLIIACVFVLKWIAGMSESRKDYTIVYTHTGDSRDE